MRQKPRPNATANTVGLLLTLLLLPTDGRAQHWDLQPSPIQKIEAAGFTPSVETVIAVLNDRNNPELRPIAARALAQLHNTQPSGADEASFAALVAAMDDVDLAVRVQATQALGFFRSKESLQVLTEAFDSETDATMRSAIIRGLSTLRMREAIPVFKRIALDRDVETDIRMSALYGMENVSTKEDFAGLEPLLNDENIQFRVVAAEIMARSGAVALDLLVEIALDDAVVAVTNGELIDQVERLIGEPITDSSSFATHENRARQLRLWWEQRTVSDE